MVNKTAVKRAEKASSKVGASLPGSKNYIKSLSNTMSNADKAISKIRSQESSRRKGGVSGTPPNSRGANSKPRGGVSGRPVNSRGGR